MPKLDEPLTKKFCNNLFSSKFETGLLSILCHWLFFLPLLILHSDIKIYKWQNEQNPDEMNEFDLQLDQLGLLHFVVQFHLPLY